jgi:hypothetical protein
MSQNVILKYTGVALPLAAATPVLFSTVVAGAPKHWAAHFGLNAYHFDLKHDQSLTVRGYHSKDRGVSWFQFYSSGVLTAPALTSNDVVLIEGFEDFMFDVLIAGTNQGVFVVNQDLCEFP